MRTRTRLALAASTSLLLALTACGGDDDSSASTDSGQDAESTSTPDEPEGEESDLPEVPEDRALDALGQAVSSVVSTVEDYEIDGTTLTLDSSGPVLAAESDCAIIWTAAGAVGVPEGTVIEIAYDDETVTCEPL